MPSLFDEDHFWMKNLESWPRRFPSSLPVMNVGYCPAKIGRLETVFDTFNFSFILSGEGEYSNAAGTWKVVAPCILIQAPGENVSYGPESTPGRLTGKQWEEFYIKYDGSLLSSFETMGFFDPNRPVWNLNNTASIHQKLGELYAICEQSNPSGMADRADRICESLILESLLNEGQPSISSSDSAFQDLFAEVEEHYLDPVDFTALARKYGFSEPTFRRQWKQRIGIPPARYLMERRLQHASHLLIKTNLSVGEIADQIHFEDPLYFSRKFKTFSGLPPSEFRKRFQS